MLEPTWPSVIGVHSGAFEHGQAKFILGKVANGFLLGGLSPARQNIGRWLLLTILGEVCDTWQHHWQRLAILKAVPSSTI